MKKIALWTLVLALGSFGPAFAQEAAIPEPAEAAPEVSAAEPAQEVKLPDSPSLDFLYQSSCSAVCGTFTAATSAECTDTNCYAMGCGAPNGYDTSSCTCYCSYCF